MRSKNHISRAQIDQFTSIVRVPPGHLLSPIWLEEQEKDILNLQPSLLRPRNLALRFMERLSDDRAVLCQHHKKLNAIIVRTLFESVQRECTYRMMPFIRHPTTPQDTAIQEWRKRMIGINSLWTERETFYHIHDAKEGDPVHPQIKNHCEACILATIGGHQQMLTDLYISANGRGNAERRSQPVAHMVECWLDTLGVLDDTYESCKNFYRLIRAERSRMQRERRVKRRAKNAGRPASAPEVATAPENPHRPDEPQPQRQPAELEDEKDAEDEKAEIIDFYTRRLSTLPTKSRGAHRNDSHLCLHPAIRVHIGYEEQTGQYERCKPEVPPMPPIPYGYAGLDRSNTVISRDSRNDPSAWQQYRSDSPISDDSRRNSRSHLAQLNSPSRSRRRSKDATEYSGSIYSRAADKDINDSGYASSLLSDRDRMHEQNLKRNPTNADVARNRKDAYSKLVGMPSAYESEAAPKRKTKTLYEFEPDTDDELEIEMQPEQKASMEMKADRTTGRLENRQEGQESRGSCREGEGTTDAQGGRRMTKWGDFCTIQEEGKRGHGRGGRDKKNLDRKLVKGKWKTKEDKVQRHFMEAFRKGLRED